MFQSRGGTNDFDFGAAVAENDEEWHNIPAVMRSAVRRLCSEHEAMRRLLESLRKESQDNGSIIRRVSQKQTDLEIDVARQSLLHSSGPAAAETEGLAEKLRRERKRGDRLAEQVAVLQERAEESDRRARRESEELRAELAELGRRLTEERENREALGAAQQRELREGLLGLEKAQQAAAAQWAEAVRDQGRQQSDGMQELRRAAAAQREAVEANDARVAACAAEVEEMRRRVTQYAMTHNRRYSSLNVRVNKGIEAAQRQHAALEVALREAQAETRRSADTIRGECRRAIQQQRTRLDESTEVLSQYYQQALEAARDSHADCAKNNDKTRDSVEALRRAEAALASEVGERLVALERATAALGEGVERNAAKEEEIVSFVVDGKKSQLELIFSVKEDVTAIGERLRHVERALRRREEADAAAKTKPPPPATAAGCALAPPASASPVDDALRRRVEEVAGAQQSSEHRLRRLGELVQSLSTAVERLDRPPRATARGSGNKRSASRRTGSTSSSSSSRSSSDGGRGAARHARGTTTHAVSASAPPATLEQLHARMEELAAEQTRLRSEVSGAATAAAALRTLEEKLQAGLGALDRRVDGAEERAQQTATQCRQTRAVCEDLRAAVGAAAAAAASASSAAASDDVEAVARELPGALLELETVKRRVAGLEAARASLPTSADHEALARHVAQAAAAVEELRPRVLEAARRAAATEQRMADVAAALHEAESQCNSTEYAVSKMAGDMTRLLENVLRGEEAAAAFRGGVEDRLRHLSRSVSALELSSVLAQGPPSAAPSGAAPSPPPPPHHPAPPPPPQQQPSSASLLAATCTEDDLASLRDRCSRIEDRLRDVSSAVADSSRGERDAGGPPPVTPAALHEALQPLRDAVAELRQRGSALAQQRQEQHEAEENQRQRLWEAAAEELRASVGRHDDALRGVSTALDDLRGAVAQQREAAAAAPPEPEPLPPSVSAEELEKRCAATEARLQRTLDAAVQAAREEASDAAASLGGHVTEVADAVAALRGELASATSAAAPTAVPPVVDEEALTAAAEAVWAARAPALEERVAAAVEGAAHDYMQELARALEDVMGRAEELLAALPRRAAEGAEQLGALQEQVAALGEVAARGYPREELEERLENLWVSVVSLLARKADDDAVDERVAAAEGRAAEALRIAGERLRRDVRNWLADKVSLAELQRLLEANFDDDDYEQDEEGSSGAGASGGSAARTPSVPPATGGCRRLPMSDAGDDTTTVGSSGGDGSGSSTTTARHENSGSDSGAADSYSDDSFEEESTTR